MSTYRKIGEGIFFKLKIIFFDFLFLTKSKETVKIENQ